ncbi:Argininosuccinate lyase [Variovorax sp. PBS-H4]|uniref:Bug family tripartite tricarboxylate transporter substrate binding protein n=1 Tax=Variovorax sp. PBS-H4 TaxID=434008 RepID=UPI001315CD37|nr:tripartite tricarboxylate transporter substrate binding protein [Variovorax sp. PBS-H4]VTU22824.1 Argininosuccinate lyase [Variovorax sp. PBS-H4]
MTSVSIFVKALAALLASAVTASHAWPVRPVRVIVPAAAGTAPDVAMRVVAERMAGSLGQPVVVDNRPGAGGVVAMKALQASRDDHALLFVITSTASIAPVTIRAASSFDYVRDLRPVVRLAQTPLMIVAAPNVKEASLGEVVDAAKKQPGRIAFGTPGASTLGSLAVQWLSDTTGAKFNAIPFLRPADSIGAVATAEVSYFIDGISVVLPFVRANKVKPIAVLSATKLPGLEAYPLGVETIKDFEVVGRFGLMAPQEFSAEAIDSVGKAAISALKDPRVVLKLTNLGLYPQAGNASEYLDTLKREIELWHAVVKRAGITAE